MPKRLPDRFQPETIAEFRAAALQRSLDAIALRKAGRRAGAIYLWGYVAEMILKAAFFDVSGFPRARVITRPDLRTALLTYAGASSNPNLHDLDLWGIALVNLRRALGANYVDPTFANLVRNKAQTLSGLWSVGLRYHKNIAHPHEIAQAHEAAEWLLARSLDL